MRYTINDMRSYARTGLLCALLFALCAAGCSRELPPVEVRVNGQAAMIAEAATGEALFEKAPDKRYPPASTAKVMTAIIAVEKLPLNKKITPSARAVRVEPTIAGLKPGVKYELRDLISAILIKSANDAAVVIAEAVAGSEKAFAELMNERAVRLGMDNTHFATASGLPTGRKDSQYTTARDLVKMMRYALRYKVILDAMSRSEAEIFGSDGSRIYLKTHNKTLLWDRDAPWGKTGYTRQARRTFVGVDPSRRPRIVFSLLRSNALWDDIRTLKSRGLEIYGQEHRNRLAEFFRWIREERAKGRKAVSRRPGAGKWGKGTGLKG